MPEASSTPANVPGAGFAGSAAGGAVGSSANATPHTAEFRINAEAINCLPCLFIRFNLPIVFKCCEIEKSRTNSAGRWRRRHRSWAERLLHSFPVERNVQAFALLFLGYAQANGHVDDFQNDKTHHKAVNQRGSHAPKLGDHGTVCPADFLAGEDAGEQSADDAADTMHTRCVERVVISHRA